MQKKTKRDSVTQKRQQTLQTHKHIAPLILSKYLTAGKNFDNFFSQTSADSALPLAEEGM